MATLYPPIVAATQPAFIDTETYDINFSLSNVIKASDIGHIQIRLVFQSNNKTAVNIQKYPDGIIYKTDFDINKGIVTISHNDLAEQKWISDTYYKVQLRFGSAKELWGETSNFSAWKQEQIKNNQTTLQTFGEWSTIMVLKCIDKPVILFADQTINGEGAQVESVTQIDSSLTPLLVGRYSSNSYEPVDKFKFEIYDSSNVLFLDSGWLQHNAAQDNNIKGNPVNSIDEYRFSTALTNNETYKVIYSVQTKNGYIGTSSNSYLSIIQRNYSVLNNIILSVDDSSIAAKENGYMIINISFDSLTSGQFVLLRTDEYSDYNIWKEICYFTVFNQIFPVQKKDYAIESGIGYKYALVKQDIQGNRSAFLYETDEPIRRIDFEYSYLLGSNHYLKLIFDNVINSFKKNVLLNKQDTIGGKYATVTKNGASYYTEFQLEGLISVQTEEEPDLWTWNRGAAQFPSVNSPLVNSEEEIKYLDNSTHLTDEQYFIERKYREEIIEFLNDGKYKLYKSPTEGNILVVLTNVNLTPKKELNKLLYSFSATAYEVGEPTLENLDNYNLINIESNADELDYLTATYAGQVTGLFTTEDIVDIMYQQFTDLYSDMKLTSINSITVDRYPDLNYVALIEDYKGQLQELSTTNVEDVEAIEKRIAELEAIQQCAETMVTNDSIILSINGNEVRVAPGRTLTLSDVDITSLKQLPHTIDGTDYFLPLVIYYTGEISFNDLETQEYSDSVQKVETLTLWGQLNGIFESDFTILRNYNSNYKDLGMFLYDETNNNENRNYIVIQSKDVLTAIKKECKRRIENKYGIELIYNEREQMWFSQDNKYAFCFEYLQSFSIEADRGTTFYLNKEKRIIGETGFYQSDKFKQGDINSLNFDDDEQVYALIDFYCCGYLEVRGE